ncbi:MAG: phosphoglycerate mutase [Rhodobacterales bacterium]|nr:MAG: phosphoglycerate mutase [Pseudomonadota bacterium]PIE10653.1 MAG: phosphoglycerate mutase [Rhodobacterales bacterium]
MAELILIRHGQASFGTGDYDRLSPLGHQQSVALGQVLAEWDARPGAFFIGSLRRQRETLEGILTGMGKAAEPEIDPNLNEFDFEALLHARFPDGSGPDGINKDHKTHFRCLRETVLMWQRDEIDNPPETWDNYCARVEAARANIMRPGLDTVLAVSSGGTISQLIGAVLGTPAPVQIKLQLQMKNCAVNRFIYSERSVYLHSFNEVPHINASNSDTLLTYS